mmetsp:Transcript_3133/g.5829  ORF Transcript_3133/g.5829 Transcript_3133/m.5829 type:complete len:305 (+) Transcript_3133:99-1013(+)|eukprot:CAMPEP_0197530852 /NCGR_PEP_ID=MMETSP1318-20131121/33127_1 /TAXON_ID=552666 /ORGANISM="Partenskyella glossopodia, Strain RCC365" /LENGTH=304 /DNA_ID=CAMNT_0043086835 /DNA_START=23 /DNA_END=937 /DNA_ORIENTATION=+
MEDELKDFPRKGKAVNEGESYGLQLAKFLEILKEEEDSDVDLSQLREAARVGIPSRVRGQVWKLLLGVISAGEGKDSSLKLNSTAEQQEPNTIKTITDDVAAFVKKHEKLRQKALKVRMGGLICMYMASRPKLGYRPGMLAMLGVCVHACENQSDIYAVFSRIHDLGSGTMRPRPIVEQISSFLALFRQFLPSLSKRFTNEDLSPNKWALQWLQNLLACSLPLECTLRAWDTYLSEKDGWNLHKYVCLAILAICEEDLQELDLEELEWYLRHLPVLDMDKVMLKARNIRSVANKPGRTSRMGDI